MIALATSKVMVLHQWAKNQQKMKPTYSSPQPRTQVGIKGASSQKRVKLSMADHFTLGMKEIAKVLAKNSEFAATPLLPKEPANDSYSMKECMRLLCDIPGIVNGSPI